MPFVVTGFSIYPIILGCLFVPSDRPHTRDRRVDWLGAIAITAAQILLTLGLTFSIANNRGWESAMYVLPRGCAKPRPCRSAFQPFRLAAGIRARWYVVSPSHSGETIWQIARASVTLYAAAVFAWGGVDVRRRLITPALADVLKNFAIFGAYP